MKENSSLFIAGNEMAIRSFNFIAMLSSDNGLLTNQKLADSLERAYMSYIVSGFNPFKEANPTKFIEEFNEEFSNMKFKDSLIGNKILQELNVVDGVIQTRGTKKLVNAENDLIDAWSSLESSNPEFSERLAKYSYLTSSFLTGPTTFHQYIPVSFYNKNYFNNYLSSKIEEINLNKDPRSIDFNFIKQFAEHNLDNPMLSGKNKLVNKVEESFYLVGNTPSLKIINKKIKPNEKGIKFIYNWNINETVNSTKMESLLNSEIVGKKEVIGNINLTNVLLFEEARDITKPKPVKLVEKIKEVKEVKNNDTPTNFNPTKVPEEKRQEFAKYVTDNLGEILSIKTQIEKTEQLEGFKKKKGEDLTTYEIEFKDGKAQIFFEGGAITIPASELTLSMGKLLDIKVLVGIGKLIDNKWLDSGRTKNDWNSMTTEERNNEIECL